MTIPKSDSHRLADYKSKHDEARVKRAHMEKVDTVNPHNFSFKPGRILGQGTYGVVHEAMNEQTGEMVALKRIELQNNPAQAQALHQAQSEIDLLRRMRHPNVVGVKGSFQANGGFYVVMELVSGRSIADLLLDLGPFHEAVIKRFTKQMLQGLAYCHSRGCLHRDIKGKNILLTVEGTVKICDFGGAKLRDSDGDEADKRDLQVSSTFSYTPLWVAPEAMSTGQYNEGADVWSLGCVVVEMASGKDPWSEKGWRTPPQAIAHIANSNEIPKIPERLSEAAQEFIRLALRRDPRERPSAAQLLKHRWLTGAPKEADPSRPVMVSPPPSITNSAQAQIDQMTAMVEQRGAPAGVPRPTAAAAASSAPMMVGMGEFATEHLDLTNVDTSHLNGCGDEEDSPPPPPPPMEEDQPAGVGVHDSYYSASSFSLSSHGPAAGVAPGARALHHNASVARIGGGAGGASLFDSSGLTNSRFVPYDPSVSQGGNSAMSSSADGFEPAHHPAARAQQNQGAPLGAFHA